MKFLVLFAAAILAVQALSPEEQWSSFKLTHKKTYRSAFEDRIRRVVFNQNLNQIEEHNKKYEQGLVSYKKAVNQFADLTKEEFLAKLTLSKATRPTQKGNAVFRPPMNVQLDDQVDWRTQSVVTGVKDQGQCGSCWSFSATGALEGQNALHNNALISLSEQNLVDCSSSYGNAGCSGGWMDSAFQYVRDNGITTEDKYPYEAVDANCRYSQSDSVLRISGFTDIAENNEDDLKSAVATVGPIAVAIDASSNLQFYSEGLFNDNDCNPVDLNHGVLAVGYGSVDGSDYWLVKNSWSDTWGEQGYVRMARNRNNQCGIATAASYPNL